MPVHFFGGAVVALGVFTLRDLRFISPKWLTATRVVGFVLFVALVWEVYEVLIGLPIDDGYYVDTAQDIIMGLSGGVVGYFVGKRLHSL